MSLTKVQINLGTTGNLSGSRSLASGSFASRITTAETELTNTILSSSVQIGTDISGSFGNQRVGTTDSPTFNAITVGTATVTGTLTAQEIHSEFESASILFTSGSTHFGNSSDDIHNMTGSLNVSGGINLNDGTLTVTDNVDFNGDLDVNGTTNLDVVDIDGAVTQDGGHFIVNEAGANYDFRVESDGNTHAFVVDGAQGFIGMGASAPGYVNGNDHRGGNTQTTSGAGGLLHLEGLVPRIILDDTGDTPQFAIEAQDYFSILELADDSTTETTRLRIAKDTGNVGIGTASPDQKLHLYSTSANSPNILIQNENDSAGEAGAAGGIEFYLKDDNGSNPDFQDLGIIRWTGHDKDNPYNKFTAAAITGSSDDPGNSSGRIDFGVAYSDSMINTMTIRAASSGVSRVGIGSTSPGADLDVGHATDPRIRMTRTDSTVVADEALGSLQFAADDPSAGAVGASIQAKASSAWSSNNYGAYIRFLTTPDNSGDQAERMRITEDGYVGIGTDNPGMQLSIMGSGTQQARIYSTDGVGRFVIRGATQGDLFLHDESGGTNLKQVQLVQVDDLFKIRQITDAGGLGRENLLVIKPEDNSVGIGTAAPTITSGRGLHIRAPEANLHAGIRLDTPSGGDWSIIAVDNDDRLLFYDNENSQYGLAINENKHVGIGNTSPSVRLDVDSEGSSDIAKFHNDSSTSGLVIGYTTNLCSFDLAASQALRIRQAGGVPFLLNTNGVMDGDFNDTSDIALKKNINDLSDTLQGVKALKPSTFKWKDESRGDETKIGFIAQDVEEQFPELVNGEDGTKSINTIGLVSVLTKTVQELIKRIEELEK